MTAPAIGGLRLWYTRLGSTNDLGQTLLRAGYRHGTVIIADYQTAGRGRLGRRWDAEPGAGLLCSILLRPRLPAARAALLTMAAAVATADAIATAAGVPVALKWPNDVLVQAAASSPDLLGVDRLKKVAGILIETSLNGAVVGPTVVGIGVNVAGHPGDITTATSLARATGRPLSRRSLLDALLHQFEHRLGALEAGDYHGIVAAWRTRLVMLGQQVEVHTRDGCYEAVAEDVAEDGSLIIRTPDGRRHAVHAADVSLRAAPVASLIPSVMSPS